jgi:hypothetical protein
MKLVSVVGMKPVSVVVLAVAVALAGSWPATAQPSGTAEACKASGRSGDLQEQIRQIRRHMPEPPSIEGGHLLVYGLKTIDAVHFGLGILGAEGAVVGLLEIVGPIAGALEEVAELGNLHVDAINNVIAEEMRSGFSQGVVLGADGRSLNYVKRHFVKWSKVRNGVYPEYGARFQKAYNTGLVAGYAQGKCLTREESGAFFSDLFSRMKVSPSVTYGPDSKQWSERTWVEYYGDTAAVFTAAHLK